MGTKSQTKQEDKGAVAQASLKRITRQAAKCDHLATQVVRAKAGLKAAQSDYDNAVEELRSMSREPSYPLLDTSNEWRELEIKGLGLTEKQTELIAEAVGGESMGHLADWLKENQITNIRGFGASAQEKFDDAMERFWKEHPQPDEDGGGSDADGDDETGEE